MSSNQEMGPPGRMGQGWHVREAPGEKGQSELREYDYSSFALLLLRFYFNFTISETNSVRPR